MIENAIDNITQGIIWLAVVSTLICATVLMIAGATYLITEPETLKGFTLLGGSVITFALNLVLNKYL